MSIQALIELLEVDKKELDTKVREVFTKKLRDLRKSHEAQQEAAGILVPTPKLIIPDNGGRLH